MKKEYYIPQCQIDERLSLDQIMWTSGETKENTESGAGGTGSDPFAVPARRLYI